MRIETALYSSREGINVHGQALGVVGDNVSNANTVGYKKARIEFSDLFAEGKEGSRSVVDPAPGNGAQVAAVRQIFDGGIIEFTGRSLDAAIDGGGMFAVGDASAPMYTRAGNFTQDENGLLVTSDGLPVLGFPPDGTTTLGPIDLDSLAIGGTETTTAAAFANLSSASDIAPLVPVNPLTFGEIGANANFVSTMTVYDSLGEGHDLTLAFYKTASNEWTAQTYANAEDVGGVAGTPALIGTSQLSFSTTGVIDAANVAAAQLAATPAWSNGAAAGNITIDLSGMSQFGGATVMRSVQQDGEGAGDIADYEIDVDGGIYAVLESGTRVLAGTIPLATFLNPDGLTRAGSGLYEETQRSGQPTFNIAGSGTSGSIQGAALERSTVDIANEFTDLVLYQRGYQANSQVFQAVGTIMRDTINLIR